MSHSNLTANAIAELFVDCCNIKNYQFQQSEDQHKLRIEISNFSVRTIVNISYKGNIWSQGKQNSLKNEIDEFIQKIIIEPQSLLKSGTKKSCAVKYDIMQPELREEIKKSFKTISSDFEEAEHPKSNTEYKSKITKGNSSITLTQYNNGTLFLQGKSDQLLDECCDRIEKIANPSEEQVIARFISNDEKSLEVFTLRYTTELIEVAEKNVRDKIGDAYNYLELHDQKWFVASECLCLSNIPLPEFSPLVMPASKAFEGFAKKLLVDVGLFSQDHFTIKHGNFSNLNDPNNLSRKAICGKDKHANSMLKKISVCLDTNRNFMMHSDDSKITKVYNQKDAEMRVNIIYNETKEVFGYFSDLYNIL